MFPCSLEFRLPATLLQAASPDAPKTEVFEASKFEESSHVQTELRLDRSFTFFSTKVVYYMKYIWNFLWRSPIFFLGSTQLNISFNWKKTSILPWNFDPQKKIHQAFNCDWLVGIRQRIQQVKATDPTSVKRRGISRQPYSDPGKMLQYTALKTNMSQKNWLF